MIFFSKSINIKVTKQIVNPITDFAANFKVLKNESKWKRKITKWRVLFKMQNTTIFEPVISRAFTLV